MRNFILTVICLHILIFTSFSQVNDAEARAAYLLAEEYYGKADYPTALKYIESAKKSLTQANCKILYLQIQIEKELHNQFEKKLTDKKTAHRIDKITDHVSTIGSEKYSLVSQTKNLINKKENILNTIEEFQNAPDIKSFNQEKNTEILKIKLEIKQTVEEIKLWLNEEEKFEENFHNYGELNSTLKFKLGQTLEGAKVSNPLFFKKTTSSTDNECMSCKLIKSSEYPLNNIYVKGNTIVGFRNEIKEYIKVDLSMTSENRDLVQKQKKEFGFEGVYEIGRDRNNDNIYVMQHTWQILGEPKIIKVAVEQSSRSFVKYSGKLVEYIFSGL